MIRKITTSVLLAVTSACMAQNTHQTMDKITYPTTRKTNDFSVYFNQKVNDPYRWLEDDRSKETEAWVVEQNKLTQNYLSKIPYRQQIKEQLTQKWNYEKIGAPSIEGNYTYYSKNDGLQNQSVIYRKDKNGKEEIFLDPNTFSKDGTTSLSSLSFTEDGSLAAYTISEGGSDWRKVIVLKTQDKSVVGETLVDVKFSGISWYKNEGFYYSSYDKPTGSELSAKTDQHKLYYHKLGTPQKEDQLIYGGDVKRRYVSAWVTNDQKYLIITTANATYGNELYIKDLTKPDSAIQPIVTNFNNTYSVIDSKDGNLFIHTDLNAPNYKLMVTSTDKLKVSDWKEVIPTSENVLSVSTAGGYLFAEYTKDAISVVKQLDYSGKLVRNIQLPGIGTAVGFHAKEKDKVLYFSFTNYITPSTIYKLDISSGKSEVYQKPKIDFNTEQFESKQIFYTSKDGTKIPMIITYKKGTVLNGTNPTILYGYGGFNISLTPSFSIANAIWLENGGIYAVANLRGGGEYGKKWHNAGTKTQKQNVFDDFIAAGEYLIKEKYTSKDKIAIKGGSNGGLLVGATLTQRPDLFKVALPAVGVLDMLRYHTFTAGAGWAYDYGTAEDSKEMFDYLKAYSPLHNVRENTTYPATLVTTGDHDDRVVPAHSYKFISQLQDKNKTNVPTLIRIAVNAGHGAGKSVQESIQENADIQAFTLWNMGVKSLK